jgi:hypothetical protein
MSYRLFPGDRGLTEFFRRIPPAGPPAPPPFR